MRVRVRAEDTHVSATHEDEGKERAGRRQRDQMWRETEAEEGRGG